MYATTSPAAERPQPNHTHSSPSRAIGLRQDRCLTLISGLGPFAFTTFMTIAACTDQDGQCSEISVAQLAVLAGMSESALRDSLCLLESLELLVIEPQRTEGGRDCANRYAISMAGGGDER